MDFGLSEEQELLQRTLRSFVAHEFPPPRRRALFDAGRGHDAALWRGLAELGVCGLAVPEAYGGSALGTLDLALVFEVLGETALPAPLLGHALASIALAEGGSDAQKSHWLPRLADGSAIATIAWYESEVGWEPERWRSQVRGSVLSGRKAYAPSADVADLLLVGVEGGGLALVERSASGVKIEDEHGVDRTRPLFRVDFDGAACSLLGADPRLATRVRDIGLALLAADAFGAAAQLVDASVAYALTRQQFGQPIAQFQAVKHQLARLGLEVEPTRGLWWYAAHAVDHLPDDAERAPALAKAHIGERAAEVGRAAVELHGGLGFTWECDVQIGLKRALFDRAFLGTPELLRERCAALAGW